MWAMFRAPADEAASNDQRFARFGPNDYFLSSSHKRLDFASPTVLSLAVPANPVEVVRKLSQRLKARIYGLSDKVVL